MNEQKDNAIATFQFKYGSRHDCLVWWFLAFHEAQ